MRVINKEFIDLPKIHFLMNNIITNTIGNVFFLPFFLLFMNIIYFKLFHS